VTTRIGKRTLAERDGARSGARTRTDKATRS
jgi:hypothetical protein